jgi:hypothetical protein
MNKLLIEYQNFKESLPYIFSDIEREIRLAKLTEENEDTKRN